MTGYYRSPSSLLSKKVFSWPMYNNDHCLLAGKPKGNGDCSACIICRLNVVMSKTISNGVFHHISIIPIISFINNLIITLRSCLHMVPSNQQSTASMANTIDILITMATRSSIPWHCHDGHHLWLSSITNPTHPQIKYTQEQDAGIYECQVSTSTGSIQQQVDPHLNNFKTRNRK